MYEFEKHNSNVPFACLYRPSLLNEKPGALQPNQDNIDLDDIDWTSGLDRWCAKCRPSSSSSDEHQTCKGAVIKLNSRIKDDKKVIMEIGVDVVQPKETHGLLPSFSKTMIDAKNDDVIYIGVDLKDRKKICSRAPNVYTLVANSHSQDVVRNYLLEHGVTTIDILLIDGYHSVNTTINDWSYAELLDKEGVVLIHDTWHPGPRLLIDAIDKSLFSVSEPHRDLNCHGFAVIEPILRG